MQQTIPLVNIFNFYLDDDNCFLGSNTTTVVQRYKIYMLVGTRKLYISILRDSQVLARALRVD
jgi:hypothetical protein